MIHRNGNFKNQEPKKSKQNLKKTVNMKEDVIKCFLAERTVQRGMQNLCYVGGWMGGWKGLEEKRKSNI